jgi:hypothetical protein
MTEAISCYEYAKKIQKTSPRTIGRLETPNNSLPKGKMD